MSKVLQVRQDMCRKFHDFLKSHRQATCHFGPAIGNSMGYEQVVVSTELHSEYYSITISNTFISIVPIFRKKHLQSDIGSQTIASILLTNDIMSLNAAACETKTVQHPLLLLLRPHTVFSIKATDHILCRHVLRESSFIQTRNFFGS